MSARAQLEEILAERILVLDGAMGTQVQELGLTEEDVRGERFRDNSRDLRGDVDVLNLTRPDDVERIHGRYLAAGAEVLTTNTFTATPVSQAEYGLDGQSSGSSTGPGPRSLGARSQRTARDSSPARSGRRTSRSRCRRASTTPAIEP